MLVDKLLPERLRHESVDVRRRARLCVYAVVTANIACVLVIGMLLALGNTDAALKASYSLLLQSSALVILALSRSVLSCGHYLTTLIFVSTLPFSAAGSEYSTFAIIALPLLATNLISITAGIVWTLLAAVWAGLLNPFLFATEPVIQGMNYSVAIMTLAIGVASIVVEQARASAVAAADAQSRLARIQFERIRAFAEGAFPAIVELRRGTIEYMSAGTRSLLGYLPESMLGTRIKNIIHPEDYVAQKKMFSSEPDGFRLDIRMRHKDGAWIWVQVFGIPFGPVAEERWVFAGRNNTDERDAQERLLRAQKLEGVGVLAAGIAHDFNNLLTVIMGFGELLPDSMEKREIVKASADAANLTGQLMAFGQKSPVSSRAIDAVAAFEDMKPLFKSLLEPRIVVAYAFNESIVKLQIDLGQLNQVILNLIKNAKEAIMDSGRIDISLRQVKLSKDEAHKLGLLPKDYAKICVRDDGVGMSAKAMERAFDPFYTTKQPGLGSGLGLASTYGIVTQFGGSVLLESKVGIGTLVTVYLPVADLHVDGVYFDAVKDGEKVGNGARVLLVDDDHKVRKVVTEVLVRAGFEVTTAMNGKEAIEKFESVNPDILLTDIVMAGMRGTELVETLRQRQSGLPALLISGYAGEEMDLLLDSGDDTRFLAKPFRSEELLNQVNALLFANSAATDNSHS